MKKLMIIIMCLLISLSASSCYFIDDKETEGDTENELGVETGTNEETGNPAIPQFIETEPDFEVSDPLTEEDERRIIIAGKKLLEHWEADIVDYNIEPIINQNKENENWIDEYYAVNPSYGPATIEEAKEQLLKYFTEEYVDRYITSFVEKDGILYYLKSGYYDVCNWEISDFIRLSENDGYVTYHVFGCYLLMNLEEKQKMLNSSENYTPYVTKDKVVLKDGKISEITPLDWSEDE